MLRRTTVTLEPPPIRRLPALSPIRGVLPALAIAFIAAATLAGAWFFQLVLDIRPCPLCLEQRYAYYLAVPLGLGGRVRRRPRGAAAGAAGRVCGASARRARQCLARRLSRRRRMAILAGPDRLLRSGRRSRQRRHAAGAARHRKGDPLRRGAVALPRPLARRLQRADLAAMAAMAVWGIVSAKRA